MKKRLLAAGMILALCLTSMATMAGCGSKTEDPFSDLDLSEYVKIGKYKELTFDKINVSVSDDEVRQEIENRRQAAATTEEQKSGTVKDGDTIKVSFEGKIDGKTFEGGSSDDYTIEVGTTKMIDGFVEGLIGHDVGETVTLDLKFPDDYTDSTGEVAEVAGKDVTFTVKIKSLSVQHVPEYDLDFIKSQGDYDSKKAYEAAVKQTLLDSKTEEADLNRKQALWEQIVADSEAIKYPEEERQQRIDDEITAMKEEAEEYDMEWEDYLKTVGYSEDELNDLVVQYVETNLFQEMLIYAIAEQEELEITDDEYTAYIDQVLSSSGLTEDSFESMYGMSPEAYFDQQNTRASMLLLEVMDKVIEYGTEKA